MFGLGFQAWWSISFIVLLAFTFLIGWSVKGAVLGILIDNRGRYSLTHFQLVLWTIVILSSLCGVLISKGFDPENLKIPNELLALMGISAGSGILATGVKGVKDAPGSSAIVARIGKEIKDSKGNPIRITAKFSQIWLEEEGEHPDTSISISKYQNFIFTLIILGFYISGACKCGGLPELHQNVLWLIGISHSGYVGGKIPNKA